MRDLAQAMLKARTDIDKLQKDQKSKTNSSDVLKIVVSLMLNDDDFL